MSDLNLRFLPWLRRGLARSISANTTESNSSIDFQVKVGGRSAHQTLQTRGPGDVVGINPAQVLRTVPAPGTLDAEPNYFPYIEFVTPDLPWMFTPTAPDADDRLLPWFTLVTVQQDLATIRAEAGAVLPILSVPLPELLLDLEEMWAWAHVQTTQIYANSKELSDALRDEPGAFISRMLSPRNLKANTAYLSCLVPTYKAGVYAGLGLPIPEDTGQQLAWDAGSESEIELPVYYSWGFTTGTTGDFQALATRLQPIELDETVGRRVLDISDIGIPLSDDVPDTTYFFGALVSPTAMLTDEQKPTLPDKDHGRITDPIHIPPIIMPSFDLPELKKADPIRQDLYDFLTIGADEPDDGQYDYRTDDPVVTPAIFGREQLKGEPLPAPPNRWNLLGEEPIYYSVLNTLPRTRGAAGLGTRIARKHQEKFMTHAWSNVSALQSINQILQQATYASLVANQWQTRIEQLDEEDALQVTRSAHPRILPDVGKTIWGQLRSATVPNGLVSIDFQRMVRSGGVVHRSLRLSSGDRPIQSEIRHQIVTQPGKLVAISEHKLPRGTCVTFPIEEDNSGGIITLDWYTDHITDTVFQTGHQMDVLLEGGLRENERVSFANTILTANLTATAQRQIVDDLMKQGGRLTPAMNATRATADKINLMVNRQIEYIASGQMPKRADVTALRQQVQSLEDLLQEWSDVISLEPTDYSSASLSPIARMLQDSLASTVTIHAYLDERITLNGLSWGDRLIPTWLTAEPLFTDAVYRYVVDLNPEYMLPGIGEIPQNTVGLVQVNGEFVEAVLIGINHEMSREMRWREYPADLSGTWFKRFWSASLDDISNIGDSKWAGENTLGENLTGLLGDNGLVLLIKGEILQRYPNLAVYAVQATAITETDDNGQPKRRLRVVLQPETEATQRFPVFSGQLGPGIKFFGFDDLEIADALGTATPDLNDTSTDGGFFFALQEQPTEPRFGLNEYDANTTYDPATVSAWNQLSWGHFMSRDDPDSPAYLPLDDVFHPTDTLPDIEGSSTESTWGTQSAQMARIVLQRPVRVLIHASAMLP